MPKADTVEKLIAPLLEQKASISYARQQPHHGANIFASFARTFNYPQESYVRSMQDMDQYGVYTFFCSNSCAAYRNVALDQVGLSTCTTWRRYGRRSQVIAAGTHHRLCRRSSGTPFT